MSFTPIDPNTPGAQFGRTKGGGQLTELYPNNDTAYLQAGVADSLKIRPLNDSFFKLSSVDLAGYSTVVPDFAVQFMGYRADGSTVSALFSGSGLNFQTFYFGPEFSDLTRVEIPSIAWSLDNLGITIPEPAAGTLVLTALSAGTLFWRRTR